MSDISDLSGVATVLTTLAYTAVKSTINPIEHHGKELYKRALLFDINVLPYDERNATAAERCMAAMDFPQR